MDILKEADIIFVEEVGLLRELLRIDARLAMDYASTQAKRYYDKKHCAIEFNVRDEVYFRFYDGYYFPGRPSKKLFQQRSGPFLIKRRVGRLAYEFDLPDNIKIWLVIFVAYLSPIPEGDDPFYRRAPPPGFVEVDQDIGDIYEVEVVMKHRLNRNKSDYEYFIKWKGYGYYDNTWMGIVELEDFKELITEYWDRNGGRPPIQRDPDYRGPGRFRKQPEVQETPANEIVKRGLGRSRKSQLDESGEQPQRRGPGRPCKDQKVEPSAPQLEGKRGRGRPRKG